MFLMPRFLEYESLGRILIPTNKNPITLKAAEYISNILPNAKYYLLGVVDISGESTLLYSGYSADHLDVLESIEKEALEELKNLLLKKNVKIEDSRIEFGFPSRTIINYAKKNNINLIILATSSKLGSEELKLGYTARKVIEKSKIPTFLMTPKSECRPIKRILNPTSGSKYSFRASMLSINFAAHFGAEVKMLHFGRIKNQHMVKSLIDYSNSLNVKIEIEEFMGENKVHGILEEAKKSDIMIASRGRKGISYKFRYFSSELALGKVEKEVIELSPIPLILVNE